MTDLLWLRLLLVGGYSGLVCYHGFQQRPLRIPLAGSFFFVIVNSVMIVQIFQERFVHLTEDEENIYKEHFELAMSASDFKKLVSYGEVINAEGRQQLVTRGEPADLVFIIEGVVEVEVSDEVKIHADKAGLIGECFMSGEGAAASCFSTKGCRYIIWNGQQLHNTLRNDPALRHGLESKIGHELLRKLGNTTEQLVRDHYGKYFADKRCECGNRLNIDAIFCRRCGKRRDDLPDPILCRQ